MEGKLNKFLSESCLLEQAFVKDPDQTVQELLTAMIAKMGENMAIKRCTLPNWCLNFRPLYLKALPSCEGLFYHPYTKDHGALDSTHGNAQLVRRTQPLQCAESFLADDTNSSDGLVVCYF